MTAPGWYHAEGDAAGTQRYWDGELWVGDPVSVPHASSPSVPPPPPSTPSAHNHLAKPGTRIWARLIDIVILFVVLFAVISFDIGGASDIDVVENSDFQLTINGRSLDTRAEFLLFGIIVFGWHTAWIHLKGATPGKLLLNLRIADAETLSGPPNLQQSALRSANHFLPILSVISVSLGDVMSLAGFLIGLISLILLFSDDEHRTVMDRIASTRVTTGYR